MCFKSSNTIKEYVLYMYEYVKLKEISEWRISSYNLKISMGVVDVLADSILCRYCCGRNFVDRELETDDDGKP